MDGRVAVVTGAGSGIGRQVALRLAEQGAPVVGLVDRDRSSIEAVASLIEKSGARAVLAVGNVADRGDVERSVAEITAATGVAPTVLVNSAGNASSSSLELLDEAEWTTTIGSHVTGTFHWSQVVLPGMIDQGMGSIVNVASIAGKRGGGFLGTTAYCAAKAAVIGLTKAMAKEAGPFGIRVNSVSPGVTMTPRVAGLVADDRVWEACLAAVPLHRAADPSEISIMIGFLASDAASFICGENLNIDGGVMME